MAKEKVSKTGISINKAKNGELNVRAVSKNGNITVSSETVKRRASCFKNILATAQIYLNVLDGEPITDEHGNRWKHVAGKFIKVKTKTK